MQCITVGCLIRENAIQFPNKKAVVFIKSSEISYLTFSELNDKAGALAYYLVKSNLVNQRILLIFPTGLDFVIAYIACLYAGSIPIPVSSHSYQLNYYIENAGSRYILTTNNIKLELEKLNLFKSNKVPIILDSTSVLNPAKYYFKNITDPETIAYVQYTSGTTGTPKGALISHDNLISSLRKNSSWWNIVSDDIALARTPNFYVYGLISELLLPLYNGNTVYIMPPIDAIDQPLEWLNIISNYKISYAGCANLGYQQCIDKIDEELLSDLDLSSWKRAIVCGGDLMQTRTLENFSKKFERVGFNSSRFCVAYGMSEMTGFVTSTEMDAAPTIHLINTGNHSYPIMSCGKLSGLDIKIIDGVSLKQVSEGEQGEICISGSTLCKQYIDSDLNCIIENNIKYLKTGDIGFIISDELYILTRKKELLCIAGAFYSQAELERVVREMHFFLKNSLVVTILEEKYIIFIIEMTESSLDAVYQMLANTIFNKISLSHRFDCQKVIFVHPGSLVRTATGKLRRREVTLNYFSKTLAIVSCATNSALVRP